MARIHAEQDDTPLLSGAHALQRHFKTVRSSHLCHTGLSSFYKIRNLQLASTWGSPAVLVNNFIKHAADVEGQSRAQGESNIRRRVASW